MNSKKLYFILIAVVTLLAVGLVGGAYGANSLLQAQAQTLVVARSKSAALDQQQTQLAKAKANVAKYEAAGNIAKSIVPLDKDQAQTVREIVGIATANGIKLGGISFPSSTLGAAAVPTPGATPGAGASGAGGTTAPKPAGAAAGLSQLVPVPSISGVYTLQITVQADASTPIPYEKFLAFLEGLENNRRTALVSAITLQPDAKDPTKVSFTLNLDEYIKP